MNKNKGIFKTHMLLENKSLIVKQEYQLDSVLENGKEIQSIFKRKNTK